MFIYYGLFTSGVSLSIGKVAQTHRHVKKTGPSQVFMDYQSSVKPDHCDLTQVYTLDY